MIEELSDLSTDMDLYKKFLLGNNEAFNHLIVKYRKMITDFIMYYVKEVEVAEDIAQDSFLYMIINKKEYDFKYSFKTYLYTIARSRTFNYLKKGKKEISVEDINLNGLEATINIEDEVLNNYNRERIESAIAGLKREYQVIIVLYYFQNFKYKEISEILNISMSKTKMMINRAKKKIKKLLMEEDMI